MNFCNKKVLKYRYCKISMAEKSDKVLLELKYNLKLVHEAIKNKKFSHAVTLFSRIEGEFDPSYSFVDEKLRQEIAELKKEFILYLRINEAYHLAEIGNLAGLRAELDYIHNNLYGLENNEETKSMLDYLIGNYNFCLEYYTFKLTKRHFIDEHQGVKGLIESGNLSKAKKRFAQLILIYNKLQDYCCERENEDYYSQLKELFKQISLDHLIGMHKKQEIDVKSVKIIRKKREETAKFHNNFEKIRNMLERGDAESAAELLKRI